MALVLGWALCLGGLGTQAMIDVVEEDDVDENDGDDDDNAVDGLVALRLDMM